MTLDITIRRAQKKPAAYVLMSGDGRYLYKGACRNLKERLKDHRAGRVSHTKNCRPLKLVYHEYYETYSEALKKEMSLKSGQGRQWLKQFLTQET